jgi:hypothetical protein
MVKALHGHLAAGVQLLEFSTRLGVELLGFPTSIHKKAFIRAAFTRV